MPTSVAAVQRALENAGDGDAAEKIAVVEIGDLHLQDALRDRPRAAGRRHDGLEERLQIGGIVAAGFAPAAVRHAGFRVGVEHGEIELVFGGVEIDEEVVDFVEHGGGARVGAVDLVQHDDGRQLGLQRLLQDVARLRQRAFAGVHQQEHAIHHAQGALDFAAEIAVAGRVHDVDLRVVDRTARYSWPGW